MECYIRPRPRLGLHIPTYKVCNKVSLCEYCQRQSCIHWPIYPCQKIVRGGRSLLCENLTENDQPPPPSKKRISNQYFPVAPQPNT